MIGPVQDIRRGDSFPTGDDAQTDGSLFVRTDLPGLPVFQYDAPAGCYVQIESLGIRTVDADASGAGC